MKKLYINGEYMGDSTYKQALETLEELGYTKYVDYINEDEDEIVVRTISINQAIKDFNIDTNLLVFETYGGCVYGKNITKEIEVPSEDFDSGYVIGKRAYYNYVVLEIEEEL